MIKHFERDTGRAMPEGNVQMVRRAVEAFNRGDFDLALEQWSSDGVWDWSNSHGFDAGVFRGHAEIREFWQRFLDAFDELRFELEELAELREGVLIADNVGYVRGRDGIEAQARSSWLITTADGKIVTLTMFQTRREALAAAGLSQ
jgi:ketosteroid isomerase-like protein